MNLNEGIEKLYSFLDSRTPGNASDEVRNEAINLFHSLFKNNIIKENDYKTIYNNYLII